MKYRDKISNLMWANTYNNRKREGL